MAMSASLYVTCGETHLFPSHNVFQRFLNSAIQSIQQCVAQIFGSEHDIIEHASFCGRICWEEDMGLSSTNYLMSAIGRNCQLNSKDCSSYDMSSGHEKGQHAVFNALDNMLKGSLERLKMMRENISLVKIGLRGYACEYSYTEHAATVRLLCLEGKLEAAIRLQRIMVQKGFLPDVFTHNHIVNGLCKVGLMEKAHDWLVREMLEFGPLPNLVTYNTLIKGYCTVNSVDKALYLYSSMADTGIQPNRVTCNILVHALCENGHLKEAKKMLEEILNDDKDIPDLVTSTVFMDHYFKNREFIQAFSLWNEMRQNSMEVDVVAYNVLINGLCKNQLMNLAYGYACEMLKKGVLPDAFTYNILIGALWKEGKTREACYILGVMSKMGIVPDEISYKVMIRGLCFDRDIVRAKELLWCMLNNLMVPKPIVWNLIIDLYGRCKDVSNAILTRDLMLKFGVHPNVFTYNALILAHVKSGNIYRAYSLKEEMLTKGLFPDVVTYNLLIGAACNLRSHDFALQLRREMVQKGHRPDLISYTELVRESCIRGNTKEAEERYAKILKSGLMNDHVPVQILFNMYCKLKEPVKAFNLFQDWLESKRDS
ncbi:pentatricopeptide repeat-containing protein At5g24830 isoform X2 [Lotus japonicus]|uniref:pentatricopeptide repeat-containing protein At5g24830 isoform X2 n=1 Tax=Lotus japonicus TaxID=34305 RepID=UPI00258BB442|nr:pentatricopeptide repeat-containing protein At5g24830 isoform X2 [Lotus japonicus]